MFEDDENKDPEQAFDSLMEYFFDDLDALNKAQRDHDEAFNSADQYKWSYYGSEFKDKIDDAKKSMSNRLKDMIDARIDARLSALQAGSGQSE
jgi:hypothetical protein